MTGYAGFFTLKDAIGPILAAVVSHMGIIQQLQLTSFHLVLAKQENGAKYKCRWRHLWKGQQYICTMKIIACKCDLLAAFNSDQGWESWILS